MKIRIRKCIIVKFWFIGIMMLGTSFPAFSQWVWNNPMKEAFPVFQNQGFVSEIGNSFQRLPDRAKQEVRSAVWNLSRETAGLALCFNSDAPQIRVRYQVTGGYAMPHMPSTGVSGVDLYRIDEKNCWTNCFTNYSFGDTIVYTYQLKHEDSGKLCRYCLYLPLYNGVKWMQIGVPENARFEFLPSQKEKPVVVYGTSIAQGACASRPGMAWTNMLQRQLHCPVVNLGFSGNGKLEESVLTFIREIDARCYVIDCMANMFREQTDTICFRLIETVRLLRKNRRDTPILLVEHAGYSNAKSDTTWYWNYHHTNLASRKAFQQLKAEKIPNLFYLSHEELGMDPDSWVDYVHPSDFGMKQQAEAVAAKIREIFSEE